MKPIIEKLRDQRKSIIKEGSYTLTISRPTDLDALAMNFKSNKEAIESLSNYVVDWDLTELDIISSGTNEPVPFDSDLFSEWIKDQPKLWAPLIFKIKQSYESHIEKVNTDKKKLQPGSNQPKT
ncbi:MAG: hypothetical protein JAY90_18540 [Candidatus Thiodiazotropha lotti]|nr:hypothetical protein [Candidatus Thiodiazotropha lotti]